jgi:hypothetical protein
MKPLVVAGVLVVVGVAAFFAGRSGAGEGGGSDGDGAADGPASERERALAKEVEDLERRLAEEKARRGRGGDGGRARARSAEETSGDAGAPNTGAGGGVPDPMAAPDAALDPEAAFSLEGVSDGREASQRMMQFAKAQLGRGDAGFAAILKAMDALLADKDRMRSLFSDETAASRELYPWIKLMVEREAQMLDLNEYVFRTMAENPQQFAASAGDDALEIFTEGFAFVLPGAVPEERLARMRGYAKKILATPESEQPDAVRRSRRDLERLVERFWAEPVTLEQALAKLRAGEVEPRDLVRYLRMLPPDVAATLDVTALAVPHVRSGDYALIRMLGVPPLNNLDVARLDAAVLEGIEAEEFASHFLGQYLSRTGRTSWSDARAFFERALGQGETVRRVAMQALTQLPPNLRPDKSWVEDLLRRGGVPEVTEKQLRATFGLR